MKRCTYLNVDETFGDVLDRCRHGAEVLATDQDLSAIDRLSGRHGCHLEAPEVRCEHRPERYRFAGLNEQRLRLVTVEWRVRRNW